MGAAIAGPNAAIVMPATEPRMNIIRGFGGVVGGRVGCCAMGASSRVRWHRSFGARGLTVAADSRPPEERERDARGGGPTGSRTRGRTRATRGQRGAGTSLSHPRRDRGSLPGLERPLTRTANILWHPALINSCAAGSGVLAEGAAEPCESDSHIQGFIATTRRAHPGEGLRSRE